MSRLASRLAALLGHPPRDEALFRRALTHPSFAGGSPEPVAHNERLEFLGDAVLGLVVAEAFLTRFPAHSEGELSRLRAAVVCEPTLARVARRLELGALLRLGQGEDASGGRDRASVLAAALEALLGALYLEEGLEAVRRFVAEHMAAELDEAAAGELFADHKTRLQEQARALTGEDPAYRLLRTEGPDHRKTFYVAVLVGGRVAGEGSGHSKKEAEQAAAAAALRSRLQDS